MILFFNNQADNFIAVGLKNSLSQPDIDKLIWLFSNARLVEKKEITGWFVGPRKEMITPWSTNAVEITQNMGISGITRIEEYHKVDNKEVKYDPMLQHLYEKLDQEIFNINRKPEPIIYIEDIKEYNDKEGLALSNEEIEYLN